MKVSEGFKQQFSQRLDRLQGVFLGSLKSDNANLRRFTVGEAMRDLEAFLVIAAGSRDSVVNTTKSDGGGSTWDGLLGGGR